MSYIKNMYGSQSPDFIKGFLAAMDVYAIHFDGKRFIGSPEEEVYNAMKSAIIALGGDPTHYLDLGAKMDLGTKTNQPLDSNGKKQQQ